MENKGKRLVRVLLSPRLVRDMDDIIADPRFGFRDRHEFVEEALEAYVLECTHGQVAGAETPLLSQTAVVSQGRTRQSAEVGSEGHQLAQETAAGPSDEAVREDDVEAITALHAESVNQVVQDSVAVVNDEPMLGLHNRDYPSLWALTRLASMTRDESMSFEAFLERVSQEAWEFVERMKAHDPTNLRSNAALFPSNPEKPEAAESIWRDFGVARVPLGERVSGASAVRADGPLLVWGAAGLHWRDDVLHIGLTPAGARLLELMDGLNVTVPHPPRYALDFIRYLANHAAADFDAFIRVLGLVRRGPDRQQLISAFREGHGWSDSKTSTVVAGYVARGREWGLIEPKMLKGEYVLTSLGEEVLAEFQK